jgi:hypothetical protein
MVRDKQYNTTKGLKKESFIVEVKSHKQAAQQLRLI